MPLGRAGSPTEISGVRGRDIKKRQCLLAALECLCFAKLHEVLTSGGLGAVCAPCFADSRVWFFPTCEQARRRGPSQTSQSSCIGLQDFDLQTQVCNHCPTKCLACVLGISHQTGVTLTQELNRNTNLWPHPTPELGTQRVKSRHLSTKGFR